MRWDDWAPELVTGVLPLPHLQTVSLVQSGLYYYPCPSEHAPTCISPTQTYFGRLRHIVMDRLFVAGCLYHRQVGWSVAHLGALARGTNSPTILTRAFMDTFGCVAGKGGVHEGNLGLIVEHILETEVLRAAPGTSIISLFSPPCPPLSRRSSMTRSATHTRP